MLTFLKLANNVQSAPVPANQNNNNNKTKKNNTGKSQNQHHKYCWTHRSCACTDGHKDDATFSNMLGVHPLDDIGHKNDKLGPRR